MTAPSDVSPATVLPAAAMDKDRADTGRGMALMLLAVGLYSVMDAMVKWLAPDYPTMQLVFFRSLFAFIPLSYFLYRAGSLASLRTRKPLSHVMRALVGIASLSGFFYAYAHMPLANVIAISFAAPLLVTALSVPLLGERVGWRRWSAVLAGFAGVLIMVKPDAGLFDRLAILALSATLLYALVIILVRKMSRTETSLAIVFYYSLASTLVAGAFMPFIWVTPDGGDWMLLILLGLIGGLAQIAITNAFRLANVAIVAPLDYTHIIWAALFGYFIWGEVPGNTIWIGTAIVMASGVYILHREADLGLRRGIARRLQGRR